MTRPLATTEEGHDPPWKRWWELSLEAPRELRNELLVHLQGVGCRILLGDPTGDPDLLRWRAYLLRDRVSSEDLALLFVTLLGAAEERSLPAPALDWREIGTDEWPTRLRRQIQPVLPVGRRLLLVPGDRPPPNGGDGRIILRLQPSGVFGTGMHPTTRLVLEDLERLFETEELSEGSRVADLGCGSGVLSLAAVRLGAGTVHAVDKDPLSVEAAVANRELNGIPEDRLEIAIGSVEALRNTLPEPSDALLCNLRWSALEPLVPRLAGLVRPGGPGTFSGFRTAELERLRRTFSAEGWVVHHTRQRGEWMSAIVRT